MNEEIIINGVNVAGCEFFCGMSNGETDTLCKCYKDMYGFDTNCKFNKEAKNCYYKQLKRLEKENSQLVTKCSQLKKENEELKRTSTEIIFNIRKESYQYYKTLEEIREITENHKKCFYGCCVDCEYQQECNGDDCSKFHIDKIIKVLESEGNNE